MRALSESTPVTVGLLVIIVGGVLWLASTHHEASEARAESKEVRAEQIVLRDDVVEMKNDIKWIKKRLGGSDE